MKERITHEYLFTEEDVLEMVKMHLIHIQKVTAKDANRAKIFFVDNQTTIKMKVVMDNYSKP